MYRDAKKYKLYISVLTYLHFVIFMSGDSPDCVDSGNILDYRCSQTREMQVKPMKASSFVTLNKMDFFFFFFFFFKNNTNVSFLFFGQKPMLRLSKSVRLGECGDETRRDSNSCKQHIFSWRNEKKKLAFTWVLLLFRIMTSSDCYPFKKCFGGVYLIPVNDNLCQQWEIENNTSDVSDVGFLY